MSRYQEIAGGYSFASLRVGMTIQHINAGERYIQPGDGRTVRVSKPLEDMSAAKRYLAEEMQ